MAKDTIHQKEQAKFYQLPGQKPGEVGFSPVGVCGYCKLKTKPRTLKRPELRA